MHIYGCGLNLNHLKVAFRQFARVYPADIIGDLRNRIESTLIIFVGKVKIGTAKKKHRIHTIYPLLIVRKTYVNICSNKFDLL